MKVEIGKRLADYILHDTFSKTRLRSHPREERKSYDLFWSPDERGSVHGLSRVLRPLLRNAKIPYQANALYLGPMRRSIVEEVKKSRWLRLKYLDASRKVLGAGYHDPYGLQGFRPSSGKIWDEYSRGVWHLLLRKELEKGVIITYEFTPFLPTDHLPVELLKSLATSRHFVFMVKKSGTFPASFGPAFSFLSRLKEKGLAKVKSRHHPDSDISVVVVQPTEELRTVGRYVLQVLHTTPLTTDRELLARHVVRELERLFRFRARDPEEVSRMWEVLRRYFSGWRWYRD